MVCTLGIASVVSLKFALKKTLSPWLHAPKLAQRKRQVDKLPAMLKTLGIVFKLWSVLNSFEYVWCILMYSDVLSESKWCVLPCVVSPKDPNQTDRKHMIRTIIQNLSKIFKNLVVFLADLQKNHPKTVVARQPLSPWLLMHSCMALPRAKEDNLKKICSTTWLMMASPAIKKQLLQAAASRLIDFDLSPITANRLTDGLGRPCGQNGHRRGIAEHLAIESRNGALIKFESQLETYWKCWKLWPLTNHFGCTCKLGGS